jgi:unsaturated pyranuronate lyase
VSAFDELAHLPPQPIWHGVTARAVHGQRVTFSVVELEGNTVIPEHSHANEQVGMLVAGTMTFRIGEERRELVPGATWSIPPNAPHEVETGPEGAVVVEVFAPGRADWAAIALDEPRAPRWPVRS